jgi:hypothetical protein
MTGHPSHFVIVRVPRRSHRFRISVAASAIVSVVAPAKALGREPRDDMPTPGGQVVYERLTGGLKSCQASLKVADLSIDNLDDIHIP